MKRILTALVLIPLVVWVVLFADWWIFLAVLATAACLSWYEYNEIAGSYGFGKPGIVGYGAGLALLAWNREIHWLVAAGFVVIVLVMVMRSAELAHALPRAALLVLGVLYVFG